MKNNWKKIRFQDFIKLQRGFDLPARDRVCGDYPIIASTSICGYHNKYKVAGECVTTGRSGALGEVLYVKEGGCWPLNTALWVKDFKGNVPKFVYYFLKTFDLKRFNSGVGVPTLNRNDLDNLEITICNVEDQKRIADVLSAYDDLIENNNRRIKILEEMAQLIYKEWFVDFKFPGHEKVKMVEGELGLMPEGWEAVKVSDLIKRVPSGKKYENKTAKERGTVPILDQGKTGVIGYHNDEPGVLASEKKPIIVFANHTCYQNLIMFPFSAIQNVLPFYPSDENYRNIFWLHWATKDLIKFNDYKGHWPEFIGKKLLLPNKELCEKFGEIINSMIVEKFKLEQYNNNLRQTRDLLLSKLMSGEIVL